VLQHGLLLEFALGYRAQVHVSDAGTKVFTRKGLNWTKRFTGIAAEFAGAGVGQAVIDGEIVVVVDSRTDFGALQADLSAGRHDRLLYYAFDLLHLDGYDLRKVPLLERKRLLKDLFGRTGLAARSSTRITWTTDLPCSKARSG
jgi:bifunctional non-homologous end joining protein LigD